MLRLRREHRLTADYATSCEKIRANIAKMAEYKRARTVMLYLPLGGEPDISLLPLEGKRAAVPVTRDLIIRPALYSPMMKTVEGNYRVREPETPVYIPKDEIDLVLVPAVAADRRKNRLGFGKGCYDRFLAGMDCVKAGVCFDFQLTDALEVNPHDVKMDYIITESGCF